MPSCTRTSTVISSTQLVDSPKTKESLFTRLFFTSTSLSSSTSSQDPEAVFREIMNLNKMHGTPEVQAFSVLTTPRKSRTSSPSTLNSPPPPPRYSKTPSPSPQEQFDEIMRLNKTHGHPSVQALSFR